MVSHIVYNHITSSDGLPDHGRVLVRRYGGHIQGCFVFTDSWERRIAVFRYGRDAQGNQKLNALKLKVKNWIFNF